jgi:hypothetical protein
MSRPKMAPIHRLPIGKVRLQAVAQRAYDDGEYFILEKNGIPIAGILSAGELEDYLDLRDPKAQERIRKSNQDYLAGKSRPLSEFLGEIEKKRGRTGKGSKRKSA